jgi:hypothetical protein
MDKGVTDQPSRGNKASVQAVVSWSAWLGHHNSACLDLKQSEYLDDILDSYEASGYSSIEQHSECMGEYQEFICGRISEYLLLRRIHFFGIC